MTLLQRLATTDAWKYTNISESLKPVKNSEFNTIEDIKILFRSLLKWDSDETVFSLLNESLDSLIQPLNESIISADNSGKTVHSVTPIFAKFEDSDKKYYYFNKKLFLVESESITPLTSYQKIAVPNSWKNFISAFDKCSILTEKITYPVTAFGKIVERVDFYPNTNVWKLNENEIHPSNLSDTLKSRNYQKLDQEIHDIERLVENSKCISISESVRAIPVNETYQMFLLGLTDKTFLVKSEILTDRIYAVNPQSLKMILESVMMIPVNYSSVEKLLQFKSKDAEMLAAKSIDSFKNLNESRNPVVNFSNTVKFSTPSANVKYALDGNILYLDSAFIKLSDKITSLNESEILSLDTNFINQCKTGSNKIEVPVLKKISIDGIDSISGYLFESSSTEKMMLIIDKALKTNKIVEFNKSEQVSKLVEFFGASLNEDQVKELEMTGEEGPADDGKEDTEKTENYEVFEVFSPVLETKDAKYFFVNGTTLKLTDKVESISESEKVKLAAWFNDSISLMSNWKLNEGILKVFVSKDLLLEATSTEIKINGRVIDVTRLKELINLENSIGTLDKDKYVNLLENRNNIKKLDFATHVALSPEFATTIFESKAGYQLSKVNWKESKTQLSSPLNKDQLKKELSKSVFLNESSELTKKFDLVVEHLSKIPTMDLNEMRSKVFSGNLGILESASRIKHKSFTKVPHLQHFLNQIVSGNWNTKENLILEKWINVLNDHTYDKDIKDEAEYFTKIRDGFQKEFVILETVTAVKNGAQPQFYDKWVNEILNALKENRSVNEMVALNKNWEFNNIIKTLSAKLEAFAPNDAALNLKNVQGQVNVDDVVSPVVTVNESEFFYIFPNFYKADKKTISTVELNNVPVELISTMKEIQSSGAILNESSIDWYLGKKRIRLNLNEGKVEVAGKTYSKNIYQSLVQDAVFDFGQFEIGRSIEKIWESRSTFKNISFAKVISPKLFEGVHVTIFKKDNVLFYNKYDRAANINSFKTSNALALNEEIKNTLKADISESLMNFVINEKKKIEVVDTKISKLNEDLGTWNRQLEKVNLLISQDASILESAEIVALKESIETEIFNLKKEIKNSEFQKEKIFEGSLFNLGSTVKNRLTSQIGTVNSYDSMTGLYGVLFGSDMKYVNFSDIEPLNGEEKTVQTDVDNREFVTFIDYEVIDVNEPEMVKESISALPNNSNYVDATINTDIEDIGIHNGDKVSVDAEQYAKLADDNLVEVIFNNTKCLVPKKDIVVTLEAAKEKTEETPELHAVTPSINPVSLPNVVKSEEVIPTDANNDNKNLEDISSKQNLLALLQNAISLKQELEASSSDSENVKKLAAVIEDLEKMTK